MAMQIIYNEQNLVSENSLGGAQNITLSTSGKYLTGDITIHRNVATQSKTNITPTESSQTIQPDSGYDGLGSVQINAISSSYVGSGIDRKDSIDLTAAGDTVTAPAGYYATAATKAIAAGSATTPATAITANPTISVNTSTGLITATASASENVTPTVSAGYVSTGTVGTITVSGSGTEQLSTQAGTTITPTTSEQVAVAANKYTLGQVKVGAIPANYITTADADAAAGDILLNKTAYVDGTKLTGSMPNNGATGGVITSQSGTYTIPAGYTSGGTVTASLTASTLTNSIINGAAELEDTNDYAFSVEVNVPAGYHNATTLTKSFSSILPAPTTEGAAAQVLAGYDLYNHNGQLVSGSMTNNSAWNRTLDDSTTSVTIPAGYHNGSGTVDHVTVAVPNPTISVNASGLITASGSWTKGFTTNNSYSNTSQLSTQGGTTITPTESAQVAVAAGKYTTGAVNVGAISSTYVGSGIDRNDDTDLIASGATVTVPAGYYAAQASKAISTGSATAPASISGSSATVSTGTNTLTLTKSVSVTPTVTAGYISAGTAGNSSVSLTANVTTKAAATITPTTTNQTIASGTYLTGTQTIAGDADLVASNIVSTANIFGVQGSVVIQNYYTGSSVPSNSLGSNGDIYLQTSEE